MSDNAKGNAKGQVALKDLGKVWESLPEPELELPNPSSLAPEEMPKQIEKIDRDQKRVHEWTRNLLSGMDQRNQVVTEEEDSHKREIAKKLARQGNQEDQKILDTYLRGDDKDLFYRQAAWLAVFEYYFSKSYQSPEEVKKLLQKLVKEDYLVENSAGPLRIYGEVYALHADSLFGDEEAVAVRQLLTNLMVKVFQTEKAGLFAQAELSPTELLAGKAGKAALSIPAEKVTQNGQEWYRGGGVLLVGSNGQDIFPLNAAGGIEKPVLEAKQMGIHLSLESLNRNTPPFVQGLPPEKRKKVQFLWHILKRGLMRYAFASKANLTPEEFFLEPNQPTGLCFLDFKGNWQTPDGKVLANFFFLVSRREEKEGTKRLRIAEAPSHLSDFFAQCMDEYVEEGNKFEGIAQPLKAVLQAVYGQVRESAKKSAQMAK